MTKDTKLLTLPQVSEIFRVSRSTIWRWEKNGNLPKAINFGRNKYWNKKDIMKLAKKGV